MAAGRVGRVPPLRSTAMAADRVRPANSGRPVRRGTAGAGIAALGAADRRFAAPGVADRGIAALAVADRGIAALGVADRGIAARGTAAAGAAVLMGTGPAGTGPAGTAAAGHSGPGSAVRRRATARPAGQSLAAVAPPAIRRVVRGQGVVRPASLADPLLPGRVQAVPASFAGLVEPSRVADLRPATAAVDGSDLLSGTGEGRSVAPGTPAQGPTAPIRAAPTPTAPDRTSPGSTAPDRAGRDPTSPPSNRTSDAPANARDLMRASAPRAESPVGAVGPGSRSAGSGRPLRRPDGAAAIPRNLQVARLTARLLLIAVGETSGQNLGTPGLVKYQKAELNQMTVKSTASSPPSTGSTHPGSPRNRRDSILAANAP